MSGKTRNADCLILILIGVLLSFVYNMAASSPYNETGVFHGLNYNLVVYAGTLAASFLLFVILTFIVRRLQASPAWAEFSDPESRSSAVSRRVVYVIYIAVIISVLILVYQIYINENNLYPENTAATFLRQMVPHPLYFGIIVYLSAILLVSLRTRERFVPNRVLRYGLMPVIAFFSAALVYCPNILKDGGAGTLHIHAVTNSIVNVMNGAPYSELNSSIYGHYGLLLAPVSFLLGGGLRGVMLSLSVCAFIAFLASFYVAHKLVRSNFTYILTVLGITGTTTLLTRRGQYFQVNPLRLLFPALTLALIAYSISHTQTNRRVLILVLEIVIGTCSLIFNLETGVFCVLLIMIMRVYRALYTDPLFSRHTLKMILTSVLMGLLSAVLAFCVVGIYNLLRGGSFGTVRQYIYPYFSGIYNVNHLRWKLPSVTYLYFFEILLFLITALIMLGRQAAHRDRDRVSETVAFAVSVMGLMSLVYFMNRAVYGNMSISHIELNLLLGYYGARALRYAALPVADILSSPSRLLKCGLAAILFGLNFWLAVEGAMYLPVATDYRLRTSWNTKSIDEATEAIKEAVPENTFAFGTCVPEVYAALGWDPGCYMIDWSDINDINREYAMAEAMKKDSFLTSEKLEFPGYKVIKKIPVGDYTFRLYGKKSKKAKK